MITRRQFAASAVKGLSLGITYEQEDCQAFVEATVRRAGGKIIDYAGSNKMYREACSRVYPLDMGRKNGTLIEGAVLFIVEQDGNEPPQYKSDSLGNASHIGIYTGSPEVIHSSASKGCVSATSLRNGWTHVGWLKAVDYLTQKEEDTKTMEDLSLGTKGSRVKELQEFLQLLGYDIGSRTGADGIFGKATQAAVEQYQRDNGLIVTGVWSSQSQLPTNPVIEPKVATPTKMSIAERLNCIANELTQLAFELSA